MSLWWVARDQLDSDQMRLVEDLPLRKSFLVLGPPGCGKTNVLLRRAQFVRGQNMPNVQVLTFTRPLSEFVKTGCIDEQGRMIFPPQRVGTIESWARALYARHDAELPEPSGDLNAWKRRLAVGATGLALAGRVPRYDALFVDEAQDLNQEEVELFTAWSDVVFFVGDDRQKIFPDAEGLQAVRRALPADAEETLRFHYRIAPEVCRVADRILLPLGDTSLEATCHYNGPKPATVVVQPKPQTRAEQLASVAQRLKRQVRVYADLIRQGDRIGIVVGRTKDRESVFEYLSQDAELGNLVQTVRARGRDETDYDPTLDPEKPICILTVKGCKGLEFRTVQWLFADDLSNYHTDGDYYTVITRAKTGLDIYYTESLPETLAGAYADDGIPEW